MYTFAICDVFFSFFSSRISHFLSISLSFHFLSYTLQFLTCFEISFHNSIRFEFINIFSAYVPKMNGVFSAMMPGSVAETATAVCSRLWYDFGWMRERKFGWYHVICWKHFICLSIIVICLLMKITEFDRNNFVVFLLFLVWMEWPAFIDIQNMFIGSCSTVQCQSEIKSILNMSESINFEHVCVFRFFMSYNRHCSPSDCWLVYGMISVQTMCA